MILRYLLLSLATAHGYAASLCNEGVACDRWVDWFNQSNPDSQGSYLVDVKVNGIPFVAAVDTGSTGFLVSARDLGYSDESELKKCCKPAFEYLSSSTKFYEGYWLHSNLTFKSHTGKEVQSYVPILAVTQRGTCKTYVDGACERRNATAMPGGIRYMGVGFGRWGSEQPDATADKNPLLNVDFEGDSTLRSGYIMNDKGFGLGIEETHLDDGWNFTNLTRNTASGAPSDRPEWNGTPVCVEVDNSECVQGTALFDTGLDYSFLGVPLDVSKNLKVKDEVGHLVFKDGVEVSVKIGVPGYYVSGYTFTVGDFSGKPQVTPKKVRVGKMHGDDAFINTGRFFFNGFSLLFDEMTGAVGVKSNPPSATTAFELR